ncbi:hypothetical protein SAMN05216376_1254 [Mameliella alba]|uniref:hypothetical protein n=1 Tax=Mameliella alba TaxID=561184 RepID=UPI000885F49E|nr:hypothetical protein [Mameliella alba]OWV40483.1 hypothetical protein CDZ95_21945 [Mameliella alba]OWV40817.1 hypothetical protein CDZ96_25555 [Mameliella alba]OWV54213.1 hypothetical protein CDZ97_24775 [Mameliella alba]PTR33736.1 hypothetical protein LX94_05032 [Mameliella alba]SDE29972.1 hypothetical protein SAMN05216376_1254 [Mameliella alba]
MKSNEFISTACSVAAQTAVDGTLADCRRFGTDPAVSMLGLIATGNEITRLAAKVLEQLEKEVTNGNDRR